MIINKFGSEHVVVHKALFETVGKENEVHVELADVSVVTSRYQDMVPIYLGSITQKSSSVFYIPALHLKTLSYSTLDEHGMLTLISNN